MGIGNIQRTTMVFDCLFSENILKEMASVQEIVKTFCGDSRLHKPLLTSFELLLEKHEKKLLPQICDILQGFLEFEFVSEDLLISWYNTEKHKYKNPKFHDKVKTAAKPFFDWLEDSGEEEEEEEEEEQTKEPAPSNTASSTVSKFLPLDDDDDSSSDVDLDDL